MIAKPLVMTLSGGLGNQLFQVSAGSYIENQLKLPVLYNISNLTGQLKSEPGNYTRQLEISELIDESKIVTRNRHWLLDLTLTKFQKRFLRQYYLFEKDPNYKLIENLTPRSKEISGFFQDAEIVESSWQDLKQKMESSNKFATLINAEIQHRIAIHLRFGDYSDDPKTKLTYGLTKRSYYLKAIEYFKETANCPNKLIIVTDNVDKAAQVITKTDFEGEIKYISNKTAIEDLKELAQSSHIVISNSTFSWWGAWIAFKIHNSKIIYPRPWFANPSDPDLPIFVKNWTAIVRDYATT